MEDKLKAVVLQLIAVLFLIIFIGGISFFRDIPVLFILFIGFGIIAIGIFIIGLYIERKARKKAKEQKSRNKTDRS
ncbi:MAG TPA: hypothetical protein VMV49_16875 [Candidatus Deferrimicrobium sp.]|nr:hypothetical protein [Candidatus Deferrimicrobium sp.]